MPSGYAGTNSGPCARRGCEEVSYARGFCRADYMTMWRRADITGDWYAAPGWVTAHRGASMVDEYEFMHDAGVTFLDIAAKLGVRPASLATQLHRAGIPVPRGVGAWTK